MSDLQRFRDNLDFIKQTILPRKYSTRPCPLQHPVAVSKNVTFDQKTMIQAQNFLPTNSSKVPNDKGAYLWMVKDGVDSLFHMGFVPQGASSFRTPSTGFEPQLNINSYANNNGNVPGVSVSGLDAFYYAKALALPRLDGMPTIFPPLADKFSRSRIYGGDMRLLSNTIATGNTVINGLLTSAVISDTRDIAQTEDGFDCFSVVGLSQSARTPKEVVRDVNCASGVISLIGPDIEPDYRAPDALNDIRVSDGWFRQSALSPYTYTTPAINGVNATIVEYQINLYGSWASPWGVQQGEGWNGVPILEYVASQGILDGSGNNAIQLPAIGESGIMDVEFNISASITGFTGTATSPAYTMKLVTVVEHYFAGISDSVNGKLGYSKLTTIKETPTDFCQLYIPTVPTSQVQAREGVQFGHYSSVNEQYIAAGGMKKLGKFIGIKTYACVIITTTTDIAPGPALTFSISSSAPAISKNSILGNMNLFETSTLGTSGQGPLLSYRALEINMEGQVGPCHILRYDDIGADQNLVLNGMINTESVAGASIATYVREQVANSKMALDAGVYPLVYALYNCHTRFCTTWDLGDYLASEDFFRNLTVEALQDMAEADPRVNVAMQSAGIFSTLGSALGGAVGDLIAKPVNSMLGLDAAGQFGDVTQGFNAAAEFGATGTFGRAMPQRSQRRYG